MALTPTKSDFTTVIEAHATVIAQDVLLRVWTNVPDPILDERLTPEHARHLAANLLHAAFKCDGERITFHRHVPECDALAIAEGRCECPLAVAR